MYKLLLLLLFLLFSNGIYAQYSPVKDAKAFQKKLHEVAKNMQSLQTDFTQIKHIDVIEEDIKSEGKLYYKNSNKLRWEYINPIQYMIVLKDGKLTINDEGKVSSFDLSSNKTFQKVNEMVVKSLQGNILLDEMEYKYEFKESTKDYLVVMMPKEQKVKEFMQKMEIYFSKKDYAVTKVKMVEQSGDYTLMNFKNKKINAAISDKVFDTK